MPVSIGRHNEILLFPSIFFAHLLGLLTGILLLRLPDLPSQVWHSFWQGRISLTSMIGCLIVYVFLLCIRGGSRWRIVAILCYFFVHSMFFTLLCRMILQAYSDIGVYLALYVFAAPAFFHTFNALLCCSRQYVQGRGIRLTVGVIALYAVRNWGFSLATGLLF